MGIVTLVPNEEKFPHRCGHEDRAMKEAWEGWGPTKWRCDLAQGTLDRTRLVHWPWYIYLKDLLHNRRNLKLNMKTFKVMGRVPKVLGLIQLFFPSSDTYIWAVCGWIRPKNRTQQDTCLQETESWTHITSTLLRSIIDTILKDMNFQPKNQHTCIFGNQY